MSFIYDTATNPPINQQGPGYTVHDGKLYVFGGSTDGTNPNNKAMVYDPGTDSWSYLADMPANRWHPSVQSVGSKIYIIGGKSGSAQNTVTNTVWEYDPSLDTYTSKATMTTARSHAFNAVVDGVIYVIGGSNGSTFNVTTNEAYNVSGNSWSSKTAMPTGRGDVDKAVVVDGLIYCVGGYNSSSNVATVEAYNPSTNSWVTGLTSMPSARDSMGIGALGGKIIVAGGYKHSGSARQKYVEVYDPVEDAWDTLPDLTYNKENPAVGVIGNTLYISHGFETNLHETITLEEESMSIPDFSAVITGGSIESEDGVITITLETEEGEEPEPILGCTDPEANNYDPEATEDDMSCTYDPPSGNGLLTDLVSYYEFQSNADDSHSSNNLTNNGSISFSSGANFGTSKYFSITDGSQSGLDLSNELTFHIKHSFSSLPSGANDAQDFVSKWVSSGNQRGFIWSYRNDSGGAPGFSLFICSNGSTNEHLRKSYTLSASTEYHLTVTWKGSTSTAEFFVNGTSIGTATGSLTGIFNNTADFLVGQQGGGNFLKGNGKYLGIWNKVLTGAQITALAGGATYSSFD